MRTAWKAIPTLSRTCAHCCSGLRVFGGGSATSAGCAEIVGIRFRSGLLAGRSWIRTFGSACCKRFGNSPANDGPRLLSSRAFRAWLFLGRESFGGELLVRRRFDDIRRRLGSVFLDLGEQPGFNRGGCPLSLRIVTGKVAGLDDYGAQLGDPAATSVVEVHKRKAGPGHRILQERDRRCRRQAMQAAQMQKSADKAMAAVSVVIRAARPVAVVGKKVEH